MGSRAQAQQLQRTGLVAPRHVGLPRPGLDHVFPALAGGFSTTAPPRKPLGSFLLVVKSELIWPKMGMLGQSYEASMGQVFSFSSSSVVA